MENARTASEPPAMDTAPRNPLMPRLRDLADALLQAYEATPLPRDHAGISKAARSLISLTRLIKALWDNGTARSSKRKATPVPKMTDDGAGLEDVLAEVLAEVEAKIAPVPAPPLNRKQRRREKKHQRSARPSGHTALAMSP